MLKYLTRNLITAAALLLAFAAPSALGSEGSHSATSHAENHRTNQRRDGAHRDRTHRDRTHRTRLHKKRSGRLVGRPTAAVVSSILVGEGTVEPHVDYVIAGQAEAFRVQASSS